MEELITFLIFVFFILIIMSILGNKWAAEKKEKQKRNFLKKQYEDAEKEYKRRKQKEKKEEREKKLKEQKLVKKVQQTNREALKNIKINGYLEDRFLIQIFDFIRKFGLKREFFKSYDDLNSKRLDKRLDAEKKEAQLTEAINDFNKNYDINEDNKILNSFLKDELENSLIKQAKSGYELPYYIDPFYVIYKNKNNQYLRYNQQEYNELAYICSNLGFIEGFLRNNEKIPTYEYYFNNKEFKKISTSFKRKGIKLTWGIKDFRDYPSEIRLIADKFNKQKE